MAYEGTPLGGGTCAGVHESQSRMWENIVGRSRGFWEYFYPQTAGCNSPNNLRASRSISSIAPSTRLNARSSAPTQTR